VRNSFSYKIQEEEWVKEKEEIKTSKRLRGRSIGIFLSV